MSGADLFSPGDVLQDRYRILRLVGRGGTGEVYEAEEVGKAEEAGEGRPGAARVAIKTVLRELVSSVKVQRRFEREFEFSQRISHPSVLRIHELFRVPMRIEEDGGQTDVEVPCMVMELLAGETLADRLIRGATVPLEEARSVVCQMAAALAAAHRAEIVHRDLKPDNVFLIPGDDGGPRVVLTDFGVARKATPPEEDDSLTASNVLLGTPTYMAPEQLELEEAMPASDIYTLGLVIFEMLTGRQPFEAASAIEMVFKRVQEDPPSPRIYLPDLDRRWEELILRCLERDPKDRFESAQEIIRLLDGDASEWLVPDRSGWWWKILLAVAVVAAAAAVWWWM